MFKSILIIKTTSSNCFSLDFVIIFVVVLKVKQVNLKRAVQTSDVCFDISSDQEKTDDEAKEKSVFDDLNKTPTEKESLLDSKLEVDVPRVVTATAGEASFGDLSLNDTSSSPNTTNSMSCYLCIKVNKNKDFISCPLNRKMKNRLSSEFWFQINDNR